MSILLDALKKSEERRQLSSAPDHHVDAAPAAVRSSAGRNWLLFALLAIAVVALIWFGWRQDRQPGIAAESSPAAKPELTAAPAAGTPRAQAAAEAEPPAQDAGQRTPVENFAADSATGPSDGAAPGRKTTATAPKKDQVNQSFTDYEAPAQAAAAPQALPETESSGAAEIPASQAVAKPSPAVRPPATATEPISYWELPQGVRDSLPDLHISVLVFAERPEDRFVLMGGQRRVAGARLADGLVLEEIRRDGAVFTYRNYRFLLKG